jgi:alpha-tubulin suppressor-like RCC1 family protein
LAANGYFSGTVTIGTTTNYTFTIKTTDLQLQNVDKSFTVTVTVTPPIAVYTWGVNATGARGTNDTIFKSSPVQLSGANWSVLRTDGSVNFGAAVQSTGTLWSWGSNDLGQLGSNNKVYRSSPVQVGTEITWSQVSTGTKFIHAIKTDGTLWAWGANNNGQLGFNDRVYRSSPVQLGSGTTWSKLSGSQGFALALKTDGTLWAWGDTRGYNVLGLNDGINRSSPTQVGALTNWSQIAAGINAAGAIKTDGTLWLWGDNTYGTMGSGVAGGAAQGSPRQVGALTNWAAVDVGNSGVIATKTNGTLWLWGGNYRNMGMNGQNVGSNVQTGNLSSPTQIGTDTNWTQSYLGITTGYRSAAAVRATGTLWAWGANPNNVLSLSSADYRSSPTQVGALTTWTRISQNKTGTQRFFGFAG